MHFIHIRAAEVTKCRHTPASLEIAAKERRLDDENGANGQSTAATLSAPRPACVL